MRRTNDELEERRVIRLLSRAAANVPELDVGQVRFLIGRTRGHSVAGAARRARLVAPAAAASAMAAAVLLAATIPGSAHPDEHAPQTTSGLVVFPEASALALLLAHRETHTT